VRCGVGVSIGGACDAQVVFNLGVYVVDINKAQ
jgi:hypothetical protein